MNRGSPVDPLQAAYQTAGFNEAPIHESGKYYTERLRRRREKRFNEAPIHESGKLVIAAVAYSKTDTLQ